MWLNIWIPGILLRSFLGLFQGMMICGVWILNSFFLVDLVLKNFVQIYWGSVLYFYPQFSIEFAGWAFQRFAWKFCLEVAWEFPGFLWIFRPWRGVLRCSKRWKIKAPIASLWTALALIVLLHASSTCNLSFHPSQI